MNGRHKKGNNTHSKRLYIYIHPLSGASARTARFWNTRSDRSSALGSLSASRKGNMLAAPDSLADRRIRFIRRSMSRLSSNLFVELELRNGQVTSKKQHFRRRSPRRQGQPAGGKRAHRFKICVFVAVRSFNNKISEFVPTSSMAEWPAQLCQSNTLTSNPLQNLQFGKRSMNASWAGCSVTKFGWSLRRSTLFAHDCKQSLVCTLRHIHPHDFMSMIDAAKLIYIWVG